MEQATGKLASRRDWRSTGRVAAVLACTGLALGSLAPAEARPRARNAFATDTFSRADQILVDGQSRLETGEIWQRDKNWWDNRDGVHRIVDGKLEYTGCGSGWVWFPVDGTVESVAATYEIQPPLAPRRAPAYPWTVHSIYWLTIHPTVTTEKTELLATTPWLYVRAGGSILQVGIVHGWPLRDEVLLDVRYYAPFLPFNTPLPAGLTRVGKNAVRVTLPDQPHVFLYGDSDVVRHPMISQVFTSNASVMWDFDQPCYTFDTDVHPLLDSISVSYRR